MKPSSPGIISQEMEVIKLLTKCGLLENLTAFRLNVKENRSKQSENVPDFSPIKRKTFIFCSANQSEYTQDRYIY